MSSLHSISTDTSDSETYTSSLDSLDSDKSSSSSSTSEAGDASLDESLLLMEVEAALDEMKVPSEDSESDSTSESSEEDLGEEADDEEVHDQRLEGQSRPKLAHFVRTTIETLYSKRYQQPRNIPVPRPPPQMPHVLTVLKLERPDHFREILRVSPLTFNKIVQKIQHDPVFFNQSNNPQIPVEEQVAITLYRFRHDGNAAGQAAVARWAGGGRGSPLLHTRRVMTAILRR